MVLVRPSDYFYAYDAIRQESFQGQSVLVFASVADVDAVCAYKVLSKELCEAGTKMNQTCAWWKLTLNPSHAPVAWLTTIKGVFKSDSVCYSVFPVSGYDDLQDHAEKLLQNKDEERTVVLINCGGTEDVIDLLGLNELPGTRVLVVDSRRPLHHRNAAEENKQVLVLYDDTSEMAEDFPELSESSSDEGSDNEDGDEEERPTSRQRTSENYTSGMSRYRQRQQAKRERLLQRAEYYGRGSFYGKSAGHMIYDIAHMLNKETNEYLWLAIVGLTDQYIHQRISQERYKSSVQRFNELVLNSGGLDMPTVAMLEDGTEVRIPDQERIKQDQDYRFMLLNHWSLYEAMVHSTYVATRLRTWKESGQQKLQLLLAKMGLPLIECQQSFSHMKPELKRVLSEKLNEYAPQFGLNDVRYSSFQMQNGYKYRLSASDVVYSIAAILEMKSPDAKELDLNPIAAHRDSMRSNFLSAFRALSSSSSAWQELNNGLQLSMSLQQAIIRQGGLAIAKRSVFSLSKFRCLNMSIGKVVDAEILSQPLALTKLAYFIQDAMGSMGRSYKPVVIAGPEWQGQVLLVGVRGRPRPEDTQGNKFGISFRRAAERISAQFAHDSFDSSVIQITKRDVQRFLGALQNDMEDL